MSAAEPLVHSHYIRSETLGNEITELCGYIYAATYQLLVRIREFDQDKLWSDEGICSCAHWLNYRCGIGMNAAREKVRVANALGDLPRISASFEKGELSYSKVRAMTRVATPENEKTLLMWARHSTAHHIESLTAKYRRAKQLHERQAADEQYRDRRVTYHYDDDGSLVIKGRFPAEQGAMLVKAFELAMDSAAPRAAANDAQGAKQAEITAETPGLDVTAETDEPVAARRADALMEMAESYLANGAKHSSSADRYQVMLVVSAETLKDDVTAETRNDGVTAETRNDDVTAETSNPLDEPISHIEDGPHVSAETSRRLCCDSSISPMLTDNLGEPLNIGRKSRTIPPPMRRALRTRDQGCRFPGCTHQRFIDGHHIRHWSDGGETSLDNLVLLCRHHHRLVHEGGFGCERTGTGQLVFRDQRGDVIGISGTVPPIKTNTTTQKRLHKRLEELFIDASTCVTKWTGERMDYGLASELLWYLDYPDD